MNDILPPQNRKIKQASQPKDVTPSSTKPRKTKDRRSKSSINKLKMLILAFLSLSAVMLVFYVIYSRRSPQLSNQQVIDKVSTQVTNLPDSSPIVATVEDANGLSSKDSFYNGASNGDKVLVYVKEKRAIIYSPKKDKIIKDGTVAID